MKESYRIQLDELAEKLTRDRYVQPTLIGWGGEVTVRGFNSAKDRQTDLPNEDYVARVVTLYPNIPETARLYEFPGQSGEGA